MNKVGSPKRIDTILFLVNDLKRSIEFYKDILRFSLSLKSPTWAEFIINDIHLALHQKSPEKYLKNGRDSGTIDTCIQLEVEKLDDYLEYLKQHNIQLIGGVKEYNYSRFIFFTDPDGHILSLREYLKTHD